MNHIFTVLVIPFQKGHIPSVVLIVVVAICLIYFFIFKRKLVKESFLTEAVRKELAMMKLNIHALVLKVQSGRCSDDELRKLLETADRYQTKITKMSDVEVKLSDGDRDLFDAVNNQLDLLFTRINGRLLKTNLTAHQ